MAALFMPRSQFDAFINVISNGGYRLIGPQLRDAAIVFDDVSTSAQLPQGVTESQSPGHYRIQQDGIRWFSWTNSAQGIKPFLFHPRELLWRAQRDTDGVLQFDSTLDDTSTTLTPLAVLGLRACDLAALALQDKHFLQATYQDPYYARRREALFIIAVNCSRSADTCFCASTGDGPEVRSGYDILLTELDDGFVLHSRGERSAKLLADYARRHAPLDAATQAQISAAEAQTRAASTTQQRKMVTPHAAQALNPDAPCWRSIAKRCLSCGNCTAVCPTCFCHSQCDEPDSNSDTVLHYRQWSSCFTREHSYMHGIVIRADTGLRYQQWFSHKLIGWHEQYGRSGCVGCGRCMTWCPVGIDITEHAAAVFAARNVAADTDGALPV